MTGIDYAGLVGKYIRMERPATEEELGWGQPKTIGMECLVAWVEVWPDEGTAEVCGDYGMSFTIQPGEGWSIRAWPDEVTRMESSS